MAMDNIFGVVRAWGYGAIHSPEIQGNCFLRACESGDMEQVVFLAKFRAAREKVLTATQLAAANGHLEVVKFLTELEGGLPSHNIQAVQWAVAKGHAAVVRHFIEVRGVDVTAKVNTLLLLAITYGHLEVVRYLTGVRGVDVTTHSYSLLRSAVANGHLEIVKFLVGLKGVDPSACDNFAVQHASSNGHLEVVKFLVGLKEVDVTARDNGALSLAVKNGHLEVVRFLAELEEVDVTARNNDVVELAAGRCHYHVVEYLLGIKGVCLRDDILREKMARQWVDEVSEEYWLALAAYNSKFAPLIDTGALRVFVCALSFDHVNETTLGALALVSLFK